MRISQYNNVTCFVSGDFVRNVLGIFIFCLLFSLRLCSAAVVPAYQLFLRFEQLGTLDNEDSIEKTFKAFESCGLVTKKEIAQSIRRAVNQANLKVRKTRSDDIKFDEVIQKRNGLRRFRLHIKKHHHLYDFLSYSRLLNERYKYAFGNKYLVEDVYQHPDRYDYSPKKGDRLVKFLKLLLLDLYRVDRFETKLHSCYGRLKAWNYSFKIEFIKLRNEILFHPWYKYRLRPGYEFFADCVSPLTYVGKVLFHVVPSVFCLAFFALSTTLDGSGSNQD